MKMITAYIKPFKLDDVKVALQDIGIKGITCIEAKGFGRQRGHYELYRGQEYKTDFVPKVKLEMVVPNSLVEAAISNIIENAATGKIGDGKIFVSTIEAAYRIRTGESGEDVL
jgi:nitrogen regulatory protein P-II 1